MRNEYYFRVAGLLFSVVLPDGWDAETILPSFHPFRCKTRQEGKRFSVYLLLRNLLLTMASARNCSKTHLMILVEHVCFVAVMATV